MTYQQWLDDVFTEHHNCVGFSLEEIQDLIEESTPEQRKKWLSRNGYDVSLDEYYNQIG